jgi:type II secretory pathway pseudopilin PulG
MHQAIERRGGRVRRARLATSDEGFGVVELLIAMTVMAVGIMAIVAGFSSGMVALNNASRAGTAGTLADKQMEAYRALHFDSIPVPLVGSGSCPTDPANPVASPWTPLIACPSQYGKGPDGRTYLVVTSVAVDCPVGTLSGTPPTCADPPGGPTVARPVKKITVDVRDGATNKTLVRETSTFDAAT